MSTRQLATISLVGAAVALAAVWAVGVGSGRVTADDPSPESGVIRTVPVETTATEPPSRREPTIGYDELVMAMAPSRPETMYASAFERGFFRSDDGGRRWTRLPTFGQYGAGSIAVDPQRSHMLYAGSDTIFKSVDGGESWRLADNGFTSAHVYALAIDPAQRSLVYAFGDGSELPDGPPQGLFVSDDAAATWEAVEDHPYVHVLAASAGRVYAGGDGVQRSTDRGRSWHETPHDMPIRLGHRPDIRSLAIAPSAPRTLYAGTTDQGVYVSRDGAESWLSIGLSPLFVMSIAVDARDPRLVYAATAADEGSPLPQGLYVSEDGGASWRASNRGLRGALVVLTHPREPHVAFAGATDAAVYRTDDAGRTWTQLGELGLGAPIG